MNVGLRRWGKSACGVGDGLNGGLRLCDLPSNALIAISWSRFRCSSILRLNSCLVVFIRSSCFWAALEDATRLLTLGGQWSSGATQTLPITASSGFSTYFSVFIRIATISIDLNSCRSEEHTSE